jgi:hypothetical protein
MSAPDAAATPQPHNRDGATPAEPTICPPAHSLSAEQLLRWVAQSRQRQGLPPGIEDPGTLARIAEMIVHSTAPQRVETKKDLR